jgi:hypothetical protein
MGTAHQLLAHYLQRLEKWQAKEMRRESEKTPRTRQGREPLPHGLGAQQAQAYGREGMRLLLDYVLGENGGRKAGREGWQITSTRGRKTIAKGRFQWQPTSARDSGEVLQSPNNLPSTYPPAAKSFRSRRRAGGNSLKHSLASKQLKESTQNEALCLRVKRLGGT